MSRSRCGWPVGRWDRLQGRRAGDSFDNGEVKGRWGDRLRIPNAEFELCPKGRRNKAPDFRPGAFSISHGSNDPAHYHQTALSEGSISWNLRPDPQGHRSWRPSFSSSSLSPCTMRWPRRTLVSDGYPFPPLTGWLESRGGSRSHHCVAWHTSKGKKWTHEFCQIPCAESRRSHR